MGFVSNIRVRIISIIIHQGFCTSVLFIETVFHETAIQAVKIECFSLVIQFQRCLASGIYSQYQCSMPSQYTHVDEEEQLR